jgi:hypothetical protein
MGGTVGLIGFILGMAALGMAFVAWAYMCAFFVALWKRVPWLIILWGISGIVLLVIADKSGSHKLFWIGGIDLAVFFVIWFSCAAMESFSRG